MRTDVVQGCAIAIGLLTAIACGGRTVSPEPTPVARPAASASDPAPPMAVIDSTALGSRANPVQSRGPFGEREYLRRLKCPSGAAPDFDRRGSVGSGADGHILDIYDVRCPAGGPRVGVFMDMYHGEVRERRAVPGFTVLPELPARLAPGCPPQVGPTPDSSARYVFNYLEVATPARVLNLPMTPIQAGVVGEVGVGFIVDTTGRPEPGSIEADRFADEKLRAAAEKAAVDLRFSPAEHHPGCLVRQGTGVELRFR